MGSLMYTPCLGTFLEDDEFSTGCRWAKCLMVLGRHSWGLRSGLHSSPGVIVRNRKLLQPRGVKGFPNREIGPYQMVMHCEMAQAMIEVLCNDILLNILPGCLSAILVYAWACMPKLATDHIHITVVSMSSTLLYAQKACHENPRLLATLASRRKLWRISHAPSPCSRR